MRATNGSTTRRRRKAMKKRVEGSWGTRHTSFKIAHQTYVQAKEYAYIGRKQKKRNFRKLWIQRINGSCRALGITYSRLMEGLKKQNITINRKMLSELAINQPEQFKAIVESVKNAK
ncbi:MAG: 50S ribosomal protein L20 [Mycoplasma sp.]